MRGKTKTFLLTAAALSALVATGARAQSAPKDSGEAAFRGLYKELVEINTTASVGSCTAAAEAMGARLKAAGFPDSDVRVLFPPEHPKFGALVATLRGKDPKAGAILLLAHIDVVEAKREDWVRDPFKLVEEDGYFYARGASDDKAMAAIFTDSLVRYKKEGFQPKRDIKLALTCGEEGGDPFNSVPWLLENHPETLKADFALNEGDDSQLDEKGQPRLLGIQVGEKVYMDYNLEVTNAGGHSSRPIKDNAIYHLAGGLARLGAYDFPIALNDATKGYYEQNAKIEPDPEVADAMRAMVKDPNDAAAAAILARDPGRNSMMRTTCVATMVEAGHAPNALPQRAKANVNCRILPGNDPAVIRDQLEKIVADPAIKITLADEPDPVSPPPPLTPRIMAPATKVAAKIWPGVPFVPAMLTGATDGRFTNAAGVPTYGLSGLMAGVDGDHIHGLNERIQVKALMNGRQFLYEVVKLYADGK
ncbi:peptidase M20 [Caulobacter sp. Root1455]|uniref:M20/M25/M40 family metallo-hydrolase n=1 Tax=unclassified Caulobacter TaxID=2648921 RepID=UPI0006FBA739|nr:MULTISPECIES: M20/M25/M40 family metallo-hydrolase [unclassified Caulobacter]KQY28863.1 peptidase M20 [Caulobacter sp. Root487D2Y]KQY99019.1 peptidase M20 [Caulobacter sp. Root1455]